MPPGWTTTRLGDLGDMRLGKMLDKAKNQGLPTQYLRNINVRWFKFDLTDLQILLISEDERELLSVQDGDLFICEGGAPGRCAVWRNGTSSLVYQKALHRFRTSGAIVPELLMYRLRHDADSGALQNAFTGTTIKHLTQESLSRYEIPLPPINEQKRIADKLDAVLARVDACRECLYRVSTILKRFRQAVLAAATAGALTEEWHEGEGLPSWDRALLGDLILDLKNGLSPKPAEQPPGEPILRISSVRSFQVNQSDVRYLKAAADVEAYRLQPKDLLFTRYNGSLEFVGVCAMVRQVQLAGLVYPDKLIRVRANPSLVLPEWIEITANAPVIRAVIETTARTSAGQTGIAGKDLKALVIPLPSLWEQAEIVRRVEVLFAYADRLEARYTAARAQVERLTPALLAKAFRGELVPQDPNDEPASVLLERIRATRAASECADSPKRRKGGGRSKTSHKAES